MPIKAIESFISSFLTELFTNGDVDRLVSCFAPGGICVGYLGAPGTSDIEEIRLLFAGGVKSGLTNLRVEDLKFKTSCTISDIFCIITNYNLIDNNSPCREMTKRSTFFLSQDGDSFKIHFFSSSLITQKGFTELMYLDVVNASLRKELIRSKQRFDVAVQHTSLSIWEYDIRERCIYQKDNAVEMHGFDVKVENVPESLIASKYVHPDSAEDFRAMYNKLFAGEKQVGGIFRVLDSDHKNYWWEKITYVTDFNEKGEPVRAIGFSTDVSEHVEVQNQLKKISMQKQALARNALFTALLDFTANKVLDIDTNEGYMQDIKDVDTCTNLGRYIVENFVEPSHRSEMEKMLQRTNIQKVCENAKPVFQTEYLHIKPNGESIWAMIFIELETDANTGHIMASCYVENIDKRKRKEIKMKNDAELDPLTGAYNRLAFKILAENLLGRTHTGHLSVFGLLDIDDFKLHNDKEGHQYGDSVLVRVSKVLKNCFRQNDIVGRLGGDEFVFLLDNVSSVEFIKKKFHSLFRELHSIDSSIKAPVYVSIGVSISPWDGNDFETLYRKADIALYAAKRSGKNRWCIYEEL